MIKQEKTESLPEPSRPVLTREQFLEALDKQIAFVSEEHQRPGWTTWAIAGSLAAIFWAGSEVFFATELNVSRAILLALAVHGAWRLAAQAVLTFSPPIRVPATKVGFRKLSEILGAVRLEVITSLLRHVSILLALFYFGYPGLSCVWGYSIIATVVYCGVFADKWFDFVFSSRPSDPAGVGVLMALLQGSVLVCAIGQVCTAMAWGTLTLPDVRLAFLLNAVFCLLTLLSSGVSTPLLHSLVLTRQDYLFGRISLESAITHTELALSGLRLSDVLHPYVNAVLKSAGELRTAAVELHKKVSSIEADLTQSGELATEQENRETIALAFRKIDALQKDLTDLDAKKRSVGRARDRLSTRNRIIKLFSSDHDQEVELISKGANDALAEADKESKAVEQQHRLLREKANKLANTLRRF